MDLFAIQISSCVLNLFESVPVRSFWFLLQRAYVWAIFLDKVYNFSQNPEIQHIVYGGERGGFKYPDTVYRFKS